MALANNFSVQREFFCKYTYLNKKLQFAQLYPAISNPAVSGVMEILDTGNHTISSLIFPEGFYCLGTFWYSIVTKIEKSRQILKEEEENPSIPPQKNIKILKQSI